MHLIKSLFILTSVTMSQNCLAVEVNSFKDSTGNFSHIRTLASTCAACHGTWGNAVKVQGSNNAMPTLAGLDANYFITQMLAFKSGERSPLIMQRHAKGLTNNEINALGIYFSQQKPVENSPLKSQILKKNHDQ